jgi:large subunit ribosomal protein L2
MAIRVYKPTSPGRRNASVNLHVEVTKNRPERSLLRAKPKTGGRNHKGVITVRGRGGGVKQMYRVIDFRRKDRDGIEGTVVGIEYDPNRTCHIALIEYADGVKRYVLSPVGLKDGAKILSSNDGPIEPQPGNTMPLRFIPMGMNVHCVELQPGKGGCMCRSAGTSATLVAREAGWAQITLPSGEIRRVPAGCRATIGKVSNSDHMGIRLG